jgi:membrane protein required for beta-lactamase induction
MKNQHLPHSTDALGALIAKRLDDSTEKLPLRVSQRLANSRKAALAAIPVRTLQSASATSQQSAGSSLLLGMFSGWTWKVLSFGLPALVLAAGLVFISNNNEDLEADEQATIDAAVLTDDVPISTYADRGFGVHIRNVQQ